MKTLLLLLLCGLAYLTLDYKDMEHPSLRRVGHRAWAKAINGDTVDYSRKSAPAATRILADVNAYRKQHGLRPLRYRKACEEAAKIQALYNLDRDETGHDNAEYPRISDRLRAAGQPTAKRCLENALHFQLQHVKDGDYAGRVFTQYHNSPAHDEQMLDPQMKYFGTYSAIDEAGTLYNVQTYAQ